MFLKNLLLPAKEKEAFNRETPVFNASDISGICEDILSQGIELRIKVTGQSMRPAIYTNDVVTVKKVRVQEIRKGDLLLIKTCSGSLILHRLKKKENHGRQIIYHTKGDSLLIEDAGVTADRILGKVYQIEKQNKSRLNFIINLESIPGRIFHSAMMLLQIVMVFRLRLRALRKQTPRSSIRSHLS